MYLDVEYCGYYMYDYASLSIGSFMIINNTITGYCYDGIDVGDFYDVGYYMYDHSSVMTGSLEFTGNDINVTNTDGAGIAFDYVGDIGENLYNYSTCTIGSIKTNNNNIATTGITDHDGIYAEIEDVGYDLYDNSQFTMGDIQFNQNEINSSDTGWYGSGMYFEYWYDIGYDMYNDSQCTLGSIEILDNTIIAGNGYGVYFDYYDIGSWLGENTNDHCVFTMGDILFNNNTITNSGDEGIYIYEIDEFGYDMYGSSTFTMVFTSQTPFAIRIAAATGGTPAV
jgi:hypothetical protein